MVEIAQDGARWLVQSSRTTVSWGSGLLLAAAVAVAAQVASALIGGPAVLYALACGVALSWTLGIGEFGKSLVPGIDAGSKLMLRIGVVLLGARVTLSELGEIGGGAVAVTLLGVVVSLLLGLLVARLLKLEAGQSIILAGATAICGASAALAVAAALPRCKPGDTVAAVAGVTIVGGVCMVVYPVLAHAFGADAKTTGVFLGATLHEVAQAVGAGFAVSPETGEAATAVKLLRVAALGPIVLFVAHLTRSGASKAAPVPWFVLGFVGLAAMASVGLLSPETVTIATQTSQWLLLIAIAALGLKTSPASFRKIGWRPFAMISVQTLILGLIVAVGLYVVS